MYYQVQCRTMLQYLLLLMWCVDAKKYKYQWSLYSHPNGDETGEMTDIDSESLKLSKVAEQFVVFSRM